MTYWRKFAAFLYASLCEIHLHTLGNPPIISRNWGSMTISGQSDRETSGLGLYATDQRSVHWFRFLSKCDLGITNP